MTVSNILLSEYVQFFLRLFALVNPIGMIPIFVSLTNNKTKKAINKINLISNISVIIILSSSLLLGNFILNMFSISIDSFRIAGGILISFVSISMLNGKLNNSLHQKKNIDHKNSSTDIAVVPLAIPLIAGPGAISSTIVWSSHYSNIQNIMLCILTIIFFSIFCWFCFKMSPIVVKILGKTGIIVITKIMGLLLLSLSIECITSGIKSIFPILSY
ncbi:YchE family NAAT transporter [Buchnera aphidicola (Taiwanaphis decaspermi)]|uniref:YchE family NAAT transporter n=1 Tax=Buchnera aphidicola TaxID=9 RepID=UPI0031B8367C